MNKIIMSVLLSVYGLNQANAQDQNQNNSVKEWLYSTSAGQGCDQSEDSWVSNEPVDKYVIETEANGSYTFYGVQCTAAASIRITIYVAENSHLESGYEVIEFYTPEVEYVFTDKAKKTLSSWNLIGFSTINSLANSDYNEETKTLTSYNGRSGVGDAFSSDTYTFIDGQWVLTESEADLTFDGQITPIIVFDNKF